MGRLLTQYTDCRTPTISTKLLSSLTGALRACSDFSELKDLVFVKVSRRVLPRTSLTSETPREYNLYKRITNAIAVYILVPWLGFSYRRGRVGL